MKIVTNFIYSGINMPIDKSKITNEMMEKAMQCETAEELISLAKAAGMEITKAEAEAYLAELENVELDAGALDTVAGGCNGFHRTGC